MIMDRIEKIKELLNTLDSSTLITTWNEYCADECMEDYIHSNDEYFFEEMFEKADEAVWAVCFGNYDYEDDYVVFNGYGNLDTFNFSDDENCPIDIDVLADWINDNDGCDAISEEEGYDEIFDNEEDDEDDEE